MAYDNQIGGIPVAIMTLYLHITHGWSNARIFSDGVMAIGLFYWRSRDFPNYTPLHRGRFFYHRTICSDVTEQKWNRDTDLRVKFNFYDMKPCLHYRAFAWWHWVYPGYTNTETIGFMGRFYIIWNRGFKYLQTACFTAWLRGQFYRWQNHSNKLIFIGE